MAVAVRDVKDATEWNFTHRPKIINLDLNELKLIKEKSSVPHFYLNWGCLLATSGPFHLHGLTLFPAWISDYIHYKACDEIRPTYPFLNFNGCTTEV